MLLVAAVGAGPAAGQPVGRIATVTPMAADSGLSAEVRSMLDRLLADAAHRRPAPLGPGLAFQGVGWEAADGLPCGTSDLGVRLNAAVSAALPDGATGGSTAGLQAKGLLSTVLRGGYQVVKTGVRLTLSVLDVQTGAVVAESHRILKSIQNASELAGLEGAVLPPGAGNARDLAAVVRDAMGATRSDFDLQVTTARGGNSAYFEGESLTVQVAVERDCYLRLYHVSWATRTMTLIFPNRRERDAFVPAGTVRNVPEASKGAVFEIAKPYGVDAIVAIASSTPFGDEPQIGRQLDRAGSGDYVSENQVTDERARGVIAKGLVLHDAGGDSAPPSGEAGAGPSSAATGPVSPPEHVPATASAAEGATASQPAAAAGPVLQAARQMARATCFFTTLPSPKQVWR